VTAWLGIASAEHVRRGVELGIAQIGHGRRAGLVRMLLGDLLVHYPPRETLGGSPLQGFTAIGRIADEEVWQEDEGEFRPLRRRVDYDMSVQPVALEVVREDLDLTSGPHWGHRLRRGPVELTTSDAGTLSAAMRGAR
jgi:hypothetical protein